MATRNLAKNSASRQNHLRKIETFTSRELIQNYDRALNDIRAALSRAYETYMIEGELTKAQMAQFLRRSNIEREIVRIMEPILADNIELLKEVSSVTFEQSFYQHAWAVDQAAGVSLQWGALDDRAVRAAVGLVDDAASLAGLMSAKEVKKHFDLLHDAFERLGQDTRKWVGREVTQGIIKGESVQKVARRLRKEGISKSYHSAMRIARTETLRATSLGSQIAYDEAEDLGVKVRQVWDATLDDRVRPDHAQMDGEVMEHGVFILPGGIETPGPHRSGIAEQDINCRCSVVAETEGYTPSVRRIRDEGLQPYIKCKDWLKDWGFTTNRYGQKYIFLEE